MGKNNFRKVQQILFIILIANFLVAAIKTIIGSIIGSASITADGFHSFSDGASNIIGLIGIRLASKPGDKEHPYGHNKYEAISCLFISVMLFVVGFKIIINAIERFKNPVIPNISLESLIILLITLVINIFISSAEYRKGKQLSSSILISDSIHTKSDIYISAGALITLVGIKIGLPPVLDPIASLAVSGFIIRAAYQIFKETIDVLVDRSVVDIEDIRILVTGFSQVKGTHNIRSRGSQNSLYIDLHILVDPNLSIEKSHELVHEIEETIKEKINKNAQVIAHLEPYMNIEVQSLIHTNQ